MSSFIGAGVSLKSQQLFLIVFVARYYDLLTLSGSLYNIVFKARRGGGRRR